MIDPLIRASASTGVPFLFLVKVSDDFCLKGGLARIGGVAVVVMGTVKGHTPGDMQAANYGKPKHSTGP